MNSFNDPRDTEIFVVGQSVITLRPDRRSSAPTEYEVIQDQLRKITETKSARRADRRSSGGR
jgi:hypothetical protein